MIKKIKITLLITLCVLLLTSCADLDQEVKSTKDEVSVELEELKRQLIASKSEIKKLIAENQELKTKSEASEKGNQEITNLEEIILVDADIDLYGKINELNGEVMRPAFGHTAQLNPSAINIEKSMRILERGSSYTKISIEGYIPTWYLRGDQPIGLRSICEDAYILEDSLLYLSPNKEDKLLGSIREGKAVKILYQYNEWYYIKCYVNNDANVFGKGWIEQSKVGNKAQFETVLGIEVKLKNGSEGYKKVQAIVGERNKELWGYIFSENKDTYTISFPGAYSEDIDKFDVIFIDNREQ